jgi:hypothetical protein
MDGLAVCFAFSSKIKTCNSPLRISMAKSLTGFKLALQGCGANNVLLTALNYFDVCRSKFPFLCPA